MMHCSSILIEKLFYLFSNDVNRVFLHNKAPQSFEAWELVSSPFRYIWFSFNRISMMTHDLWSLAPKIPFLSNLSFHLNALNFRVPQFLINMRKNIFQGHLSNSFLICVETTEWDGAKLWLNELLELIKFINEFRLVDMTC